MANKKTTTAMIFILIIAVAGAVIPSDIYAKNQSAGVVLADDTGKILYGRNNEELFIPASILKILTSLAAIQILGKEYRFSLDYYFDEDSKNLYIKGFGDPLFISEVIEQLCRKILSTSETDRIHHIILDQTYFSDQIQIPGKGSSLNPYDAPVGALCANFNTITFNHQPTGRLISAEPQTPLLDVFENDIKATGLMQGRIILTKKQSLLYPGLLIKHFLEKDHISVTGTVLQGRFQSKKEKHFSFESPFELKEVVQKLLQYSNNYIANQLLLTLGAKTYQAPATIEKGVKALNHFAKQFLGFKHLTLLEGSGLSRSNKITPDQMIKILINFLPYHLLLNRQENEFYKTGTLSGVRTRAGYILGKDNRLYPYVIMINQKNTGYDTIRKDLINRVSQMIQQPVGQ
ncbi:MAG: D-alanyl-D-alanine carboxypeptidase [Proteobacteria bacterium]|nr:D-alanyl-D-alanine carboxypeptidase [Pseudomonadota bacterium]